MNCEVIQLRHCSHTKRNFETKLGNASNSYQHTDRMKQYAHALCFCATYIFDSVFVVREQLITQTI